MIEELDELIEYVKDFAGRLPRMTQQADLDLALLELRHLRRSLAAEQHYKEA